MKNKVLTYLPILLIVGILGVWSYYLLSKKTVVDEISSTLIPLTEVVLDSKLKNSTKTPQYKPITKSFVLKNKGPFPFTIYSISPDCSCTVPEWNRKPVLPGDSLEVKLTYDAKNTGYFLKKAIIKSNSSSGEIVIAIQGEVL